MTREEHIENLKAIASDMPSDKCSDWIESLMAGVKALEQEPCENCCNGNQIEKAKLCQKSYLAGMEHKQEPCKDVVSRSAVIDTLTKTSGIRGDALKALYDLPSVTPQPKMGRWEWNQYDANPKIGNFHCSLCHSIGRTYFDYCPYCGAKMSEIPTGQIVANGELYPGEFDDPLAEEGSEE